MASISGKGRDERAQACVWAVGKFYRLIFPNQIVMVRITRAESVRSLVKRRVIEDGSEITHGHALRPPAIVMLGSRPVSPSTTVRCDDIAQHAKVLAHQVERFHVPDTVIERGRALDVGKQQRHIASFLCRFTYGLPTDHRHDGGKCSPRAG